MTTESRRAALEPGRIRALLTPDGRLLPSFWAGPWGLLITIVVFGVLCALLVGWVLVWARDDEGHNAVWLILGPIAFSAVLVSLAMLFWSLRAAKRLRLAETTFITGASHNLRTPLSAIRAAAQTLTSAAVSEDDRALLLDAILQETLRLELRIDNLLETARLALEDRPYSAGASPIDLGALVKDVHDDARWAFTARGGTFNVEVPDEPLFVVGDVRALRLLFENLVANALKYSERAPAVTTAVRRDGARGVVRVTDEGQGFDPASAEDLFVRPLTGDVRHRGAGLGLRLARSIARGHGGGLRMASPGLGKGATAEVWLPLDEEV